MKGRKEICQKDSVTFYGPLAVWESAVAVMHTVSCLILSSNLIMVLILSSLPSLPTKCAFEWAFCEIQFMDKVLEVGSIRFNSMKINLLLPRNKVLEVICLKKKVGNSFQLFLEND